MNFRVRALFVSLILLNTAARADAQDWQTVDDFVLGNGNASANGVATDAAGGVYVVGAASGHGIVRYSPDGGSTWSTRDDFVYGSSTNNVFNAVMVDNQGTVFVGGGSGGYGDGPNGHWIVRRSTDHGLTWETVDDYERDHVGAGAGTNGVVYSLCSDGHGRVYAAGPLIKTYCPCYNHWWVRGSSIGGTNWDTKLVHFSAYGGIRGATCAGEDVYVTGSTDGEDEAGLGLILRSSDHGATWTPVFSGLRDYHDAITADSAGTLYSAGYSVTSTSIVWQVRQSTPGGTDWITRDSFSYEPFPNGAPVPAGFFPAATSIAVDSAGNVCVAGDLIAFVVTTNSGGYFYNWDHNPISYFYNWDQNWFMRQYWVATGRWSTTDVFSYSTNKYTIALGTTFAPSGVFAVGYGTSDTGQQHWVVRKRAAPPAELARALRQEVTDLIARSAIPSDRSRVLLSTLDRIVAEIEQGQSSVVCNSLRTFTTKVQQFVDQGILAQSDAELLINGAANLSQNLGCPERQKVLGQQ